MRSVKIEFGRNLADIRAYLDGIDGQNNLLKCPTDILPEGSEARELIENLRRHFLAFRRRKVIDYTAIIISLYGALENFVEDLVEFYIDELASHIDQFADLPCLVRDTHHSKSAELILRLEHQKYRDRSMTADEVIGNMASCVQHSGSYRLNGVAFAAHQSNVRHPVIVELLKGVGISDVSPRLKKDDGFLAWLRAKDLPDTLPSEQIPDRIAFQEVDSLADARNRVAHGFDSVETETTAVLRDRIDAIEIYALALYNLVTNVLAQERTSYDLRNSETLDLGKAIEVIDNRIVCVSLKRGSVAIGDSLIAELPSEGLPVYRRGTVKKIQVNNVDVNRVDGGTDVSAGLEVDFYAKDNQRFFLLQRGQRGT